MLHGGVGMLKNKKFILSNQADSFFRVYIVLNVLGKGILKLKFYLFQSFSTNILQFFHSQCLLQGLHNSERI